MRRIECVHHVVSTCEWVRRKEGAEEGEEAHLVSYSTASQMLQN